MRKFTPAASRVFNLLPQDVGRPLQHISSNLRLENGTLVKRIADILKNGESVEEAADETLGDFFLMRGLPYCIEQERIEGIVLTFTDVSAVRRSQARLASMQRRMQIALDAADIGIWDWDLSTDRVFWGIHLRHVFSFSPQQYAT